MTIEIDGIPMTPEYFSILMNNAYDEPKLKVRPEQISNIKIKDITKDEIIIEFHYTPIPRLTNIFEIKTPKLKTLKPEPEACEHLIMREFTIKLIEHKPLNKKR